MWLQLSIMVRYQMSINSASTLKAFLAVRTLVVQCSKMASFVNFECSHVLHDFTAQFAGECSSIETVLSDWLPGVG